MIVNPHIKETFNNIARNTIIYMNSEDKERKYLRKFIILYKEHLTEEEQIFVLKFLLEMIYYKNITIDPENVILMNNIKLRHYFFVLLMVFGIIILLGIIFFQTGDLVNFLEHALKFFKFLGAV